MHERPSTFDAVVICLGLAFLTTLIVRVATWPKRGAPDHTMHADTKNDA